MFRPIIRLTLGILFGFSGTALAATTSVPTSWSNFSFADYKWGGKVIYDHESSQDPSHGPAHGIAPSSIDIASCSADGRLPGTKASAQIAYYSNTSGGQWIAFRMRLNDTIVEKASGATGYVQKSWSFLIDTDGDGFK